MKSNELNLAAASYLSGHPWIIVLIIWVIIWKGLALWTAAKNNHKIWFIALLIVNTLGILEIAYLAAIWWQQKKASGSAVEK